MAYMGRGGFSSIGGRSDNENVGNNENKENNNNNQGNDYGYPWIMFHTYVPLDNIYVIMQMILTFIILISFALTFILTYKSTIIDPIESTKKIFLNTHLIVLTIFLVVLFVINYSSKNENILIKRLTYLAIVSIIAMIVFFCVKLNFDYTYTKDRFERFYTEQSNGKTATEKNIVNFSSGILKLSDEKEYYVDECMILYGTFKIKTYAIIALHLLLNILIIFQISKIHKMQRKKEQIKTDDEVLYDEEQNVKY